MSNTTHDQAIERIGLYFCALGQSPPQARVRAELILQRLDHEYDLADAIEAAMDEAETLGLLQRASVLPVTPPEATTRMPIQLLGKTPVILRRGLWRWIRSRRRKVSVRP